MSGGRVSADAGNTNDKSGPGRNARDLGAKGIEPLVDPLIATLNLLSVVDPGCPFSAQGGDQHGHACADIRAFEP